LGRVDLYFRQDNFPVSAMNTFSLLQLSLDQKIERCAFEDASMAVNVTRNPKSSSGWIFSSARHRNGSMSPWALIPS
jgi:hypothetical protein